MRVLIDPNILLRAVQPSHPSNRTAQMALLALHRNGDTMCLTLQNLTEFRPPERCLLQLRDRLHEINQAVFGGQIEQAKRAGDGKTFSSGDAITIPFVDQQQVGAKNSASAIAAVSPSSRPGT